MEYLVISLNPDSAETLLPTFEKLGISFRPAVQLSTIPGLVTLTAAIKIATAPIQSIAKVLEAWIQADSSRELIVHTPSGIHAHAKGKHAIETLERLMVQGGELIIHQSSSNLSEPKGTDD